MENDYNGPGPWSLTNILDRYHALCSGMDLQPKPLEPTVLTSGDDQWIHPVMNIIIQLPRKATPPPSNSACN